MTPTDPYDRKQLTVKDLQALALDNDITIPTKAKSKSDIFDVLDASGKITEQTYNAELIRLEYVEVPDDEKPGDGDNSDNSGASNETPTVDPAASSTSKSPSPAKTPPPSDDGEIDLDTFDPDDEIAVPKTPQARVAAALTEDDVPKLAKIDGVSVRRIKKTQDHGGGRETWWCPWTDASRLSPDDGQLDQIDASKAIRLGRFAVVLPPGGITAAQLR